VELGYIISALDASTVEHEDRYSAQYGYVIQAYFQILFETVIQTWRLSPLNTLSDMVSSVVTVESFPRYYLPLSYTVV
jgi:hypothetical protein